MAITKEMSINEVVEIYPQTVEIFRNYGMGCFGCSAAPFENIEQGASPHSINIEALIIDLNSVV